MNKRRMDQPTGNGVISTVSSFKEEGAGVWPKDVIR